MYSDDLLQKIINLADECDYYTTIPQLALALLKAFPARKVDVFDTIILCVENLSFNLEAYSHLIKHILSYQPACISDISSLLAVHLNVTIDKKQFLSFATIVCLS